MDTYQAVSRLSDDICAEITPRGRGGISVIRLCGPNSFNIVARIIKKRKKWPPQSKKGVFFTKIYDGNKEQLDDAIIAYFCENHSYTGDDTVEISCHGSPVIISELLSILCAYGARPANRGEFTERSFLNGRMDLSRAESIFEIINADDMETHKAAFKGLCGGIERIIGELRKKVLYLIANIEGSIDFPDEVASSDEIVNSFDELIFSVREVIRGGEQINKRHKGVTIAICGAPNVGKSSLFNALSGEDRAIVTEISGTTRDINSIQMVIGGKKIDLYDTAGIRNPKGIIEKIGIEKARNLMERGDIIIWMLDSSRNDAMVNVPERENIIIVASKSDLPQKNKKLDNLMPKPFRISSKTMLGISELTKEISDKIQNLSHAPEKNLLSDRALAKLNKALEAFVISKEKFIYSQLDMCAEELRMARQNLDEITGRIYNDAILEEIFSRFCIGK